MVFAKIVTVVVVVVVVVDDVVVDDDVDGIRMILLMFVLALLLEV